MNYELALRLKKAGYPQKEPLAPTFMQDGSTVWLYLPTLEELIQACGDITLRPNDKKDWVASEYVEQGNEAAHTGIGAVPREAVAELWLALNK